jgi:methylthioribose-1-phosphate isomerase
MVRLYVMCRTSRRTKKLITHTTVLEDFGAHYLVDKDLHAIIIGNDKVTTNGVWIGNRIYITLKQLPPSLYKPL